jgi:uncharacterized membrane-anchored protein
MMTKVPKVTAYFWIVKLLTTAMGEATSDFSVQQINPYLAVSLGFVALVAVLVLQFSVRRYIAWVYWLTAAMVAITGTMAADVLHVALGVPYIISAAGFAVTLAVVFVVWYSSEKTLSIHSIYTPKREVFYWATVMATFALGTALGDLSAYTANLGYVTSLILFIVIFAVPALAYWRFKINAILAFWLAYIMTRPIGASFADWVAKPHSLGGLGVGDGKVSLCLTVVLIIFVVYLSTSHKDSQDKTNEA